MAARNAAQHERREEGGGGEEELNRQKEKDAPLSRLRVLPLQTCADPVERRYRPGHRKQSAETYTYTRTSTHTEPAFNAVLLPFRGSHLEFGLRFYLVWVHEGREP